jgi:hypothetical protein
MGAGHCGVAGGQYLLRVAAPAPERVAETLLALPKGNDNPAVASCVIDAARNMPGRIASRLVPAVMAALKHETGFVVASDAIGFVRCVAQESQTAAFRLADALLWFRRFPGDARMAEPASKRKPDNLLTKVETRELIEFIDSSVPALEALDAISTVEWLAQKLGRAVALGDALADERAPHAWERLGELAVEDVAGAFEILQLLVERELKASFRYVQLEHLAPPLRVALGCQDDKMRTRTEHLVHRLGGRGFAEFGSLLKS